jgi:two-component sensor histidine kinase
MLETVREENPALLRRQVVQLAVWIVPLGSARLPRIGGEIIMIHDYWMQRLSNVVAALKGGPSDPNSSAGQVYSQSTKVNWSPDGQQSGTWRTYVPSFANWSLRARLIAIVLALALPANLVIAAVVWSLASAAQDAQRTSLRYTARSVASALDAELGKYLALAMALSRSPALLSGDLTTFEQEARRTFEAVPDAWVLVADLDGQQLMNTASSNPKALPRRVPMAMEFQRRAFESRAPVVSGIRLGPVTRRWTTVIDVPIFRDGQPYRVLVVTMATEGFLHLFNAPDLPKNWLAGIIDEVGRFIARVPDHDRRVGEFAAEGWRRTAGRGGLFESRSLEGDLVITANEVSKLAKWTVGIGIKKSELNAAAWRTTRWAAALGAILSVLSLLLAAQLARRAGRQLSDLQSNARELAAGRAGSPIAPTMPELADVWNSLKSAAEERNRSDESLRQSYETYFSLIKNATFGVCLVDADFRLAEVSKGAQKIFQNVRPLLGRDFGEVLRILWPEKFAQEAIGIFQHTLATGEPYQSANMSQVRKDTAERESYDWRTERIGLPDGKLGVVCYFYDLSERLRHEEHVRLLMNELNHRAKNMIGLIQAVARRTKAGSVDDFVARFGERLQALAANQDILVKTEWRGADLEELSRAQLATFAERTSGRITISGPSLMLTSSAAQIIGMALHELATNAVKYGALSNDRGCVDFSWTTAGGNLVCTWKERDGPPVVAPTRRGFGTTVIDQMVRSSVNGSVILDYAASGLAWCLECPVANLQEVSPSLSTDVDDVRSDQDLTRLN